MCTDADTAPFNVLTYSLILGDANLFDVTATGVIRLINMLDYDDNVRHYEVNVKVTDGVHSIVVKGDVTVLPVNEHDPTIRNTSKYM